MPPNTWPHQPYPSRVTRITFRHTQPPPPALATSPCPIGTSFSTLFNIFRSCFDMFNAPPPGTPSTGPTRHQLHRHVQRVTESYIYCFTFRGDYVNTLLPYDNQELFRRHQPYLAVVFTMLARDVLAFHSLPLPWYGAVVDVPQFFFSYSERQCTFRHLCRTSKRCGSKIRLSSSYHYYFFV